MTHGNICQEVSYFCVETDKVPRARIIQVCGDPGTGICQQGLALCVASYTGAFFLCVLFVIVASISSHEFQF